MVYQILSIFSNASNFYTLIHPQMARLGFFLPPYAAAKIQTHVSKVAPLFGTLNQLSNCDLSPATIHLTTLANLTDKFTKV